MKKIIILLFLSISQFAFAQTTRQLENLEAFNRLYGYVKYFHPSDEAANLDWDKFAIYGSREVEKCKDASELQKTLLALFLPIAPTVKIIKSPREGSFSMKELTPPDIKDFKTITWQHMGVQGQNPQNPYKSGRINRTSIGNTNRPTTIMTSLNITPHRNKEFIFTASMRLEEGPGTGHLWARVDREGEKMGFFDNMDNRPVTSNEWKKYEIKGKLDNDAINLAFGCFLRVPGKLIIDNLSLTVLEGNEWKTIYTNSFETDASDVFPKSVSGNDPGGSKTLVTEGQSSDGKKSLVIRSVQAKENGLLFDRYCKLGEYKKKEIGSGLTAIIPLALYGNDEFTFPKADAQKLSVLKEQLENTSTDPDKDLYTRTGDIIIAWNVFQHFYPYFDVTKTNWNDAFITAIKEAYISKTGYDFYRTLQKLVAKLKDGHGDVSGTVTAGNEDFALALQWAWIEGQLVITKVLNDNIQIKAGDIVTAINRIPAEKYFQNVYQYISAATPGWLDYRAQTETLLGRQDSEVTLTVLDDQNTKKEIMVMRSLSYGDYFRKLNDINKEGFRKIKDSIYYINIGKASMKEIAGKLSDLQNAKALICDLRGYPQGNHELISYFLLQNDTSRSWMRVPEIIYPDQENITGYREMGWEMKPLQPHLNAKVFFIIDGRAVSYAESYMSFIEHYKLATIIGQPSAGTNGNVNTFTLPGPFQIAWTGMKVLKHDGSQHHGIGILPDVYVQKTIRGIRENKDEFLDKAIELAAKVD
jgi:C-terminal processing protease CtpA/Prc